MFRVALFLLLFPALAASQNHNVLLISVDTLRADRLGCYGYSKKTPGIDSLAAKSVMFETAISQVPLTLPSHATILTGLYPDQHGIRNNENFILQSKFKTLAEIFAEKGYSTGAVVGSFSLDSTFGIKQGFQFYEDEIGTGHDPIRNRHVERRADTVWRIGRQWLEKQKGPWFCFLHFFDPHFGYNPPKPHPQTYDGEVEYVDRTIASVGEFLQQKNLLSRTIVVFLSDHGESLGEHKEENHGVFLYDATLKVPLMILAPGVAPRRVAGQVRLVDVAPTIVELSGLKNTGFSGQTLVPVMKGMRKDLPAYSETYYTNLLMGWAPLYSIRWNHKKWIEAPKAEFYDLTQDPGEVKNRYSGNAVPSSFRTELQKHRNAGKSQGTDVDPETREKLASLGYVTGASSSASSSGFDPKDGIALWTTIESAVQSAQMKQWTASEMQFRSVLKQQPENVIAKKFLAAVLRKQGKNDEAVNYLKSALESKLHQTETRYDLAETFYDLKRYPEALQEVLTVIKTEPKNVRALTLAAALLDSQKRDEYALQVYGQLASLRDLTEQEATRAAAIALTARKMVEAEKYFRIALKANQKSVPAWKGLGLILASQKRWEPALEAFLKAEDCPNAKKVLQQSGELPPSLLQNFRNQCPS